MADSFSRRIVLALSSSLVNSGIPPAHPLSQLFQFVAGLPRNPDQEKTWHDFLQSPDTPSFQEATMTWLDESFASDEARRVEAEHLWKQLEARSNLRTMSKAMPPSGRERASAAPQMGNGDGHAKKIKKAVKRSAPKAAVKKASTKKGSAKKASVKRGATKKAAAEKVICHFRAQVASRVQLNQPVAVEVGISRKALKVLSGMTGSSAAVEVDRRQKLLVRIRALSECVAEGTLEQKVDVPSGKKETKLFFTIRPKKTGPISFLIEVLQSQILLCSMKLEPECVRSAVSAAAPLRHTARASTQKPYPSKVIKLYIREKKMGGKVFYEFDFDAPSLGVFQTYASEAIHGNRDTYIKNLYRQIEGLAKTAAFNTEDFMSKLKDWGGDLYDQLIPVELGTVLYKNADKIKSIQVVSTEPFIPWELMLVKNPAKKGYSKTDRFFGEMGLIRWLFGWPSTQELQVRTGKSRYVIPQYKNENLMLEETLKEEDFLKKKLGARRVASDPNKIVRLLRQKNGFDLLHFACHGEADSRNISNAALVLEERDNGRLTTLPQITVDQGPDFTTPEGIRPIVMVNACQAGRQGFRLTQIGGFADAFISHGAGVFVGASWSIDDKAAREFIEFFYSGLLKGLTLANTTIRARAQTKKNNPLDATWIAYAVYGDPFAKLQQD